MGSLIRSLPNTFRRAMPGGYWMRDLGLEEALRAAVLGFNQNSTSDIRQPHFVVVLNHHYMRRRPEVSTGAGARADSPAKNAGGVVRSASEQMIHCGVRSAIRAKMLSVS